MSTIDIGQTLKEAREFQAISLASAAMQTNLSQLIIDKLEQNKFREIGAPVFTRGYLTQYARFLKLDIAQLTNAFNSLNPEDTEIRLSSANIASQSRAFKRRRFGVWLLIVPLLLLVGVIIIQVMNDQSWLMTQFKQAFIEKQNDAKIASADNHHEITLQVGDKPVVIPTSTDTAIETNTTEVNNNTVPTLTSLESVENENTSLNTQDNTIPEVTLDAPTETPVATPPQIVQKKSSLKITNENWIEARNKNKKLITSKLYKTGEEIELMADDFPYTITIGRPEAVILLLNGETVALKQYAVKNTTRQFKIVMTQEGKPNE